MVHLSTENKRISHLIDDFSKGIISVPEFQRDYVWKENKILNLVDSIYKKYPTGTLLLWKPDINERKIVSKDSRSFHNDIYWLIDGQQRTKSLNAALREGEISIYFNPIDEVFSLKKKAVENNHRFVNILEIVDGSNYLKVKKNLRESFPEFESKIEESIDKCRGILDYEIPIVIMNGHNLEDAIKSFERINTSGTRLKSADISAAKLTFHHTGFIHKNVIPLLKWLKDKKFDRVYTSQLFMACSAIAKNSPQKTFSQLHTLQPRDLEKAWKKTEEGIKWAIQTISTELSINDMQLLWSGALLMPFAVIYAVHKSSNIDVNRLIRWLLIASIRHRYSGQAGSKLADDLNAVLCTHPIDKLLSNLKKDLRLTKIQSSPADFDVPIHDRFVRLGLYIALRQANAKDLLTNQKISYEHFLDLDRHHIFPISRFNNNDKPNANKIPNLALITKGANREISNKFPSDYLKDMSSALLDSQLIPKDQELWQLDSFNKFTQARCKLLSENFNDFLDEAED